MSGQVLPGAGAAELLPYRVGALMYSPALRPFPDGCLREKHGCLDSLAFCLEDAVADEALPEAECMLRETLRRVQTGDIDAAGVLLFVRVRSPEHLRRMRDSLGAAESVLMGYILPKFDLANAEAYARELGTWGPPGERPLWVMPILESQGVADAASRRAHLQDLRSILYAMPRVLNLRVGGNDLCHLFGLRRSVHQTIYDIAVVRDILADILNIFSREYVISGPVWEYFGTDAQGAWAAGLRRELAMDRLNGFVGKTAIHPTQLPVIRESLQVCAEDYADALQILNWQPPDLGVAKSAMGSRMNEVNCHTAWAQRTARLAAVYGIREVHDGDPV